MIVKTQKEYPVLFSKDFKNIYNTFKELGMGNTKLCIITDSNVAPLYLNELVECLDCAYCTYVFEAGEHSKNIDTIQSMYHFFIENNIDRKSVIVALGGGVCGDMAGFAAATYMRGIRFVQIPTTLLAQVDSSVGGKVGIDYLSKKNIIGAFYQPELVYINTNVLHTLPKRQFNAGMAEVIKHGMILDSDFIAYLHNNSEQIIQLNTEYITYIINRCVELKAEVVSADEKELGIREILNFGHTFGHAAESFYNFEMLHGECVAVGMVAAFNLSMQFESFLNATDKIDFIKLLHLYNLPSFLMSAPNIVMDLQRLMTFDKKLKNGNLSFILLNKIGQTYSKELNLSEEKNEKLISNIISSIINTI